MTFETDLKSHLQSDASIAALVNDRIHPRKLKDGESLPVVIYSIIFGETQNSLDGFTSGVVRYRVQVDCWSSIADDANELALAVRDRMNVAASTFKSFIISSAIDDYEQDTKRYRRTLEFSCLHTE